METVTFYKAQKDIREKENHWAEYQLHIQPGTEHIAVERAEKKINDNSKSKQNSKTVRGGQLQSETLTN